MRKKACLFALLAVFAASMGFAQQPAPVETEQGLVQGASEDGLTVYRGIPFAKPPVGDLRWRAPQPAEKWEGVRQATQFAPGPIQGGNPPSGKSEDCLYLNVWTPAKSAEERIPVLVWIYGGGFGAGSTAERNYSGENLAKKGVVLVSIAYRVGQLGFLAHPELTAENPNHSSGNYGLLDMIAGLEWIQKNIAAFGGDPDKVTIFGESAGGIAVSMLCASPLAKDLFHGAISQSGGSFGPPRPTTYPGENLKRLADAEAAGKAYAESAGAASIAELRKVAADRLPAGRGLGMSWPIIDGWVIPDDQYKLYEAGKFNDTPILVGYNSDEGASFSPPRTVEEYVNGVKTRYGKFADDLVNAYPVATEFRIDVDPERINRYGVTLADVSAAVTSAIGDSGTVAVDVGNSRMTARVAKSSRAIASLAEVALSTDGGGRRFRLGDVAEVYETGQVVPKAARDLARDAAFGWQTWIWARLQANNGKSKAYYYYFDQHPDYPAGSPQADRGSPHGQDVGYVFQHLGRNDSPSDQVISEAMATYWTNFAKFGHPNGEGVPEWPAFSDENPEVMVFAQTPHVGPVPSAEALKVLDAYFAWRRTPEGETIE